MIKIVIFGNSGSGKSTLAGRYAEFFGVTHLDLDTVAWKTSGVRRDIPESIHKINAFMESHEAWVIEGCYSSLIREAAKSATELIFLNLDVQECQENCKARPWEPHKYETREAQEMNLEMLLSWVADYTTRTDEFSLLSHSEIFDSFRGKKTLLKTNRETQNLPKVSSPSHPSCRTSH